MIEDPNSAKVLSAVRNLCDYAAEIHQMRLLADSFWSEGKPTNNTAKKKACTDLHGVAHERQRKLDAVIDAILAL